MEVRGVRSRRKQHFIILSKNNNILEASVSLGEQKSIHPPFLYRSTARSSTPGRWGILSQESPVSPYPAPEIA